MLLWDHLAYNARYWILLFFSTIICNVHRLQYTALHFTLQNCIELEWNALACTVVKCSALHYIKIICSALHCSEMSRSVFQPNLNLAICYSLNCTILHRMPLYFVPVSVSLRVARTLLKRLLSKNLNLNIQFTHASRHPGV